MSWESPKNFVEHLVQTSLLPASVAYGLGAYVRVLGYKTRLMRRNKLPASVISVGNVTCGGTGKTPITIDLAKRITEEGYRLAILSRGYRRKSTAPHLVVSDHGTILASCEDSGDEPYMIAKSVPNATVIVGTDRVATGALAIDQFGADVILLDDGFQHIRLRRDHDIVLLDYYEDLEESYLLPAGRLREPVAAIGRASSVVITKVPVGCSPERMATFTHLVRRYNKTADITFCQFKPTASQDLRGRKVVAFCGIAKPERFFESVKELGAEIVKAVAYPDHYWFTEKDITRLETEAKKRKADLFVTTEKDLVRMGDRLPTNVSTVTIRQETVWLRDLPSALEKLQADVRSARAQQPVTV